jgi:hypothetical protein
MGPVHASKRAAILLLAATAVGLVACTSHFDRLYAAAEQERQAAADAGYEWLETEDLLEQAREAQEAGDTELALQLVEKARFQAEAAVAQAEREAEVWQDRVIR